MVASPPHVLTLTGNLLAERTLGFAQWSPGGTFRAERESFQVGGKGINVSKMLTRLGVANTALCFAGGSSGDQCSAWLREHGFSTRIFATTQPTRTGIVVRAGNQPETTFLGADAPPDAAAIRACAEYLDAQPSGAVLAVCGSFPGWMDRSFDPLRDALARWLSRGCLVADTYGPPLAWLAVQPIELLKVNAQEFGALNREIKTGLAALRYVITDGAGPVRFRGGVNGEEVALPPVIAEVSATGSGDVMLACLIGALFRDRKALREAITYALPFAAANAAHPGIAEFPEPA